MTLPMPNPLVINLGGIGFSKIPRFPWSLTKLALVPFSQGSLKRTLQFIQRLICMYNRKKNGVQLLGCKNVQVLDPIDLWMFLDTKIYLETRLGIVTMFLIWNHYTLFIGVDGWGSFRWFNIESNCYRRLLTDSGVCLGSFLTKRGGKFQLAFPE